MIITYYGLEFFKVQFGEITLAFNPISKDSKFKAGKFGADMALVSLNHPDLNGADNLSYGDRVPFAITGPGEYEIKDIFIRGFSSTSDYGSKGRLNTIYSVTLEGMSLCFLGALSSKDLPNEIIEALDGIDVLFLPIGGEGVLNASDAYKLAVKLEPKLIIPMHYGEIGDKSALKTFLKEEGSGDNGKPVDKLTLKKKDLEGKDGEIVILSPMS